MSNSLEILALRKIDVQVIIETSLYRNELSKASCNHTPVHKYSYTGHNVLNPLYNCFLQNLKFHISVKKDAI